MRERAPLVNHAAARIDLFEKAESVGFVVEFGTPNAAVADEHLLPELPPDVAPQVAAIRAAGMPFLIVAVLKRGSGGFAAGASDATFAVAATLAATARMAELCESTSWLFCTSPEVERMISAALAAAQRTVGGVQ